MYYIYLVIHLLEKLGLVTEWLHVQIPRHDSLTITTAPLNKGTYPQITLYREQIYITNI